MNEVEIAIVAQSWYPLRRIFAMEHLPKRISLVHETANTLKEWISQGVLGEALPGEMQLKARLGVGRDTLRLALKLLAEEGWVLPAAKGQQRRVQMGRLPQHESALQEQLPVMFLSPFRVEHRQTLLEMEDTQLGLAEQGRSLRFVSPGIFHLKHPERHLERLVRTHPAAAWILYITSGPMQRWFEQQGLPAFLYELPFPGVKLPYVSTDWGAAAFHAGVQLVRQGHRRIGILEYEERRPGFVAEEQGLERALATVGGGQVLVFKDDRTPAAVARALDAFFSLKERPTALVLTRAAQLLTCYSWLASRGIRVPADLSIVSLPNDSWFSEFHPPVCYYQPDARSMSRLIAQRVLELVATGQVTRKSVLVPMDYVPGATIGPVPGSLG
jgi:DNA-binding LacI/PurR family transcriptional regulator